MTRRLAQKHVIANEAASARAGCRAAYERAKATAGLSGVLLDRWWAETLSCAEHQSMPTRIEMYRRTESLFSLIADRQTWPR